jgi:hypothetical protein
MSVVESLPVVSRITSELFDRLNKLTAGFSPFSAVYEVVRPTRLGQYTPRHLQIVLTKGSVEEVPELMCPGNPPAIAWRQVFDIRCHVMPSEKDPTPVDTYCEVMAADVVRVVCEPSGWWRFGGTAINAEWLAQEDINSDGGPDGVNVPIAITYRVDEGNPFNVRG